jgi:hypothetical protein
MNVCIVTEKQNKQREWNKAIKPFKNVSIEGISTYLGKFITPILTKYFIRRPRANLVSMRPLIKRFSRNIFPRVRLKKVSYRTFNLLQKKFFLTDLFLPICHFYPNNFQWKIVKNLRLYTRT